MIKKLVKKQLDFIVTNANITDIYEIDRIRYGLEAFYNEFSKIIVLLLISIVMNKLSAFITISLILFSVRSFIGGSHQKTTLGCLLHTLLLYIGIYIIALYIPDISIIFHLLLILITVFSSYKFKPVNHSRKNTKTEINGVKIYFIVLINLSIWFIASNLFLSSYLIKCGCLMILYITFDFLREVYKHEKIQ